MINRAHYTLPVADVSISCGLAASLIVGYKTAMRFRPLLPTILACGLILGAPAAAHAASEPVGVLAVPPAPAFETGAWLRDAGVATAASGTLLGLAALDGGTGPVGATLGGAGALLVVGAVGALPPGVMIRLAPSGFQLDDYFAGLSGGLVGLGVGYLLTAGLGGTNPGPWDTAAKVAAMAIGQGLGASTGYHLYEAYKPTATDLNKLPENRHDDPIQDWKYYRERRNPL